MHRREATRSLQLEARRDVSQVAQLVAWADGRDVSYGPSAVAQCLHFEPAAGGDGEVPPRRRRPCVGRRPRLHAARASDFDFLALGPPMASRVA